MTSKNSFRDLLRENRKRRTWCIALSILGCIFALPVFAALGMSSWTDRLSRGISTIEDIRNTYFNQILSLGNISVFFWACALAVINGLNGMAYLHSRIKTDLYDSLPVKRTELFMASYINGLLFFVLPYVIMHILAALIGIPRGFLRFTDIPAMLINGLFVIIFYFAIYTIVCLAAVLTGNTVVSIFMSAILLFFAPVFWSVCKGFGSIFFLNHTDRAGNLWRYLSPVITYFWAMIERVNLEFSARRAKIGTDLLVAVFICLVIAVLVLILTRFLVKIRPAESAGKAVSFNKFKPVLKVALMIEGTMLSMLFFEAVTGSFRWRLFGFVIGVILIHSVVEIVYEFDFKAIFRHIPSFAVGVLLTALITVAYMFDLFGYDSYLPPQNRVESAAIYSGRIHLGYNYSDPEDGSYIANSDYLLDNMKLADTEPVYVLAKKGIEFSDRMHADQIKYPGIAGKLREMTDIPYGYGDFPEDDKNYSRITVRFRLKSGRSVYRDYVVDLTEKEAFEAFSGIFAANEYKQTVYQGMTAEVSDLGELDICGPYARFDAEFSKEDREEFLKDYRQDMLDMTADTLKDEYPVVKVTSQKENKNNPLYTDYREIDFYIYPSFSRCMKLLTEKGVKTEFDIQGISSVTLSKSGEEEFERKYAYYNTPWDDGRIEMIMKNAVRDDFHYLCRAFRKDAKETESYTIDVFYSGADGYDDRYGGDSFVFATDDIPDFVEFDLENSVNDEADDHEW